MGLHLEERWPEIFEPLTAEQRRAVVQTIAASWHEGREPTCEETALLADYARGAITAEEYTRRGDQIIYERHGRAVRAAGGELAEGSWPPGC